MLTVENPYSQIYQYFNGKFQIHLNVSGLNREFQIPRVKS